MGSIVVSIMEMMRCIMMSILTF